MKQKLWGLLLTIYSCKSLESIFLCQNSGHDRPSLLTQLKNLTDQCPITLWIWTPWKCSFVVKSPWKKFTLQSQPFFTAWPKRPYSKRVHRIFTVFSPCTPSPPSGSAAIPVVHIRIRRSVIITPNWLLELIAPPPFFLHGKTNHARSATNLRLIWT